MVWDNWRHSEESPLVPLVERVGELQPEQGQEKAAKRQSGESQAGDKEERWRQVERLRTSICQAAAVNGTSGAEMPRVPSFEPQRMRLGEGATGWVKSSASVAGVQYNNLPEVAPFCAEARYDYDVITQISKFLKTTMCEREGHVN